MKLDKTIIIETICNYFDVTIYELRSKDRHQGYVKARHFAMYFLRKYTAFSLHEIGDILVKDHASVVHGIRAIINQIEVNKLYQMEAHEIEASLQNKYEYREMVFSGDIFMENNFYTELEINRK
jgi:chromosomal replication initiator protein